MADLKIKNLKDADGTFYPITSTQAVYTTDGQTVEERIDELKEIKPENYVLKTNADETSITAKTLTETAESINLNGEVIVTDGDTTINIADKFNETDTALASKVNKLPNTSTQKVYAELNGMTSGITLSAEADAGTVVKRDTSGLIKAATSAGTEAKEVVNVECLKGILGDYAKKSDLAGVAGIKMQIVDELPEENIDEKTIYLIKERDNGSDDLYDEYIYVNERYELIGSTQTTLYYAGTGLKLDGSTFKIDEDTVATLSVVNNDLSQISATFTSLLNNKQDKLTAGDGIDITSNTISLTEATKTSLAKVKTVEANPSTTSTTLTGITIGDTSYKIDSGTPTNMVTTDTEQTISGAKTFTATTKMGMTILGNSSTTFTPSKQVSIVAPNSSTNPGFTLYSNDNSQMGYLEFNTYEDKLLLGYWNGEYSGVKPIGLYPQWMANGYKIITPMDSSLFTTSKTDYYFPLTFTINSGSTKYKADNKGNVNLTVSSSGSEPTAYLKSASVSSNTLTLTNKDGTAVEYTPTTFDSQSETINLGTDGSTTDINVQLSNQMTLKRSDTQKIELNSSGWVFLQGGDYNEVVCQDWGAIFQGQNNSKMGLDGSDSSHPIIRYGSDSKYIKLVETDDGITITKKEEGVDATTYDLITSLDQIENIPFVVANETAPEGTTSTPLTSLRINDNYYSISGGGSDGYFSYDTDEGCVKTTSFIRFKNGLASESKRTEGSEEELYKTVFSSNFATDTDCVSLNSNTESYDYSTGEETLASSYVANVNASGQSGVCLSSSKNADGANTSAELYVSAEGDNPVYIHWARTNSNTGDTMFDKTVNIVDSLNSIPEINATVPEDATTIPLSTIKSGDNYYKVSSSGSSGDSYFEYDTDTTYVKTAYQINLKKGLLSESNETVTDSDIKTISMSTLSNDNGAFGLNASQEKYDVSSDEETLQTSFSTSIGGTPENGVFFGAYSNTSTTSKSVELSVKMDDTNPMPIHMVTMDNETGETSVDKTYNLTADLDKVEKLKYYISSYEVSDDEINITVEAI